MCRIIGGKDKKDQDQEKAMGFRADVNGVSEETVATGCWPWGGSEGFTVMRKRSVAVTCED